jgi:SAM-dependent methyltransferase
MLKLFAKLFKFLQYSSLRASYWRGGAIYQQINKKLQDQPLLRSLDLGSGPVPDNRFGAGEAYGVDIRCADNQRVFACDLSAEALPFAQNHFDLVTAWDLLEHIPRVAQGSAGTSFPFVQLMNEVWRVLRVDGYFFSFTPAFPMPQAFQDPTHVNIITEDTLRLYFAEPAWARIYGYHGQFKLVSEGWKDGHYFCLLQKVSDQALADVAGAQKTL